MNENPEERLPPVARRFLRYVRIDTGSNPDSASVPSSPGQLELSRMLAEELTATGLADVRMDRYGYVFGTLPATGAPTDRSARPTLALLAHVDTSPDAPGAGVSPVVHFAYDGRALPLPGDPTVVLDPAERPALLRHIGEDLITSDGTTLLGSDDKAGVAVLVQLAHDLAGDAAPRPEIRICFTIDEEIGRGVDHLDLEALGATVAYTVDGSDVDTISYETFNAASARVKVDGIGVHPGYAKDVMVNALRIAAEFISALPAAEAPEQTEGGEGYLHPHSMTASDVNRAEILAYLRDFDAAGLERRKDDVTRIVDALRARYPRARIGLEIKDQYRNMRSYIEERDPRAIEFAFLAAREMGIELRPEAVRGGTDGARLSELGIPTPNLFNGGMDYHSRFEWNTVQNLERTLAFVKRLVRVWGERGHLPR